MSQWPDFEINRSGSSRRKSIRSLKDEEDPSEKTEDDDDILTDELFDIPKDYVEVRNPGIKIILFTRETKNM